WSRRTPRCPPPSRRGRSRCSSSGPSPAARGRHRERRREERLMGSATETTPVSKTRLWVGRVVSALPVLLLVLSAVMKLAKPAPVVEGFTHLGYPADLALGLGILEL